LATAIFCVGWLRFLIAFSLYCQTVLFVVSDTPDDEYDVTYNEDDHDAIYEDLCALRRRVSLQVFVLSCDNAVTCGILLIMCDNFTES